MLSNFDWNDIPLIISLARSGSMTATGRELGVDPSTISRRIAAAEKLLQQRLFIRDNTRYQLTEAGAVFLKYAQVVYGEVHTMLTASAEKPDTIAGTVRISSIDFLLDQWLMPHLPALTAQYPQLEIHLLATNRNVSFMRREADFSLRLAQPQEDAALLMRKLGELDWAVFAAPRFADVLEAQWPGQPWITYDETLSHLPEMRWIAALGPTVRQPVRVSTLNSMVLACRAGLGLALLPTLIGASADLIRLGAGAQVRRELWLLSHRDTGNIARFKLVGAWLADLCKNQEQRHSD